MCLFCRDLEASVEGVKSDVLSKKCRANMSDVESMALTLSSVSKTLADLKSRTLVVVLEQLSVVYVYVVVRVCACVRACVHACVRACVRACVCKLMFYF